MDKDIRHFSDLQQQGRLQREALPAADMSCSLGHLTISNLSDNITRFAAKGRIQLLETNAVNNTYFPETYPRHCMLCGFHSDTNSHALNGCAGLRGLYTERHNRCVQLVRAQLEKDVVTDFVEIFDGEVVNQYRRQSCTGKVQTGSLYRRPCTCQGLHRRSLQSIRHLFGRVLQPQVHEVSASLLRADRCRLRNEGHCACHWCPWHRAQESGDRPPHARTVHTSQQIFGSVPECVRDHRIKESVGEEGLPSIQNAAATSPMMDRD